jgi:hypothetical protein
VLVAAAAATATGGCGASGPAPEAAPATTLAPRPASYVTCPASGIAAPATMALTDRELPNLGDGTLGRLEVYDGHGTRLEVTVGVDVLDGFEDLDFETEATTVHGAPATLSTAGAFGTSDRLVVLTWEDLTFPAGCTALALIGTNLSSEELLAVADGPRTPSSQP